MKKAVEKVITTAESLKTLQAISDALASVIQEVTDSTTVSGDVELMLTRTKTVFNLDASSLTNKLTQQKNKIDDDIDTLVAKITIT